MFSLLSATMTVKRKNISFLKGNLQTNLSLGQGFNIILVRSLASVITAENETENNKQLHKNFCDKINQQMFYSNVRKKMTRYKFSISRFVMLTTLVTTLAHKPAELTF